MHWEKVLDVWFEMLQKEQDIYAARVGSFQTESHEQIGEETEQNSNSW